MAFKAIHTFYGLQRLAAAEATGVAINLLQMAVGDGGGNPTAPNETQTQLVRETFRAAVNRVYQDPTNPKMFTAELIVPASAGGFVIRECGIFDSAGGLFVIANIPDAYKPAAAEGAFADTVIRLQFMVSNASVVTLMVDPNVAVATQSWILNNVTAARLIPGGTTNQLLAKRSNTDGDFKWTDLDNINVTVDCIEETQTLAANQTIVNLSTVTTRGMAVYIDGVRLRADQWTADPIVKTRLTLAQSYPAGTKIICAQNDPKGVAPDPLLKAQNLNDLPNKATARTNLGVDSKANTDTHAPCAMVAYMAYNNNAPAGWLKANGAAISRTAYATLFASIGVYYGAGDGFNTFNVPDLRGEHIRGWDDGRGLDNGRAFGSVQVPMLAQHNHGSETNYSGDHAHSGTAAPSGQHSHGAQSGPAGEHSHGGGTTPVGDHAHTTPGSPGVGVGAIGNGQNSVVHIYGETTSSPSGAHNHGINPDGNHGHAIGVNPAGEHAHNLSINGGGNHTHSVSILAAGGVENRVRNIALMAIIKY